MSETIETAIKDEAIAVCEASIRTHSKSFSLASRLLPQPARDEAVVLYAWCRRADDAVDEVPIGQAGAALSQLRTELASIYRGDEQADPVLAAFQAVVQRRKIPRHYPDELLAGMAMDVDGYAYETEADLLLYCYRVASVVGLMMCHVMGLRHGQALLNAAHLGAAMQLTNICRDVVEDWSRQRVYLPSSVLRGGAQPGESLPAPTGPFPASLTDRFRGAVRDTLRRADGLYGSGDAGVIHLGARSALAILAARHIYSDIGRIIERRQFDVTRGRAYTTKLRKLLLVMLAFGKLICSTPRRFYLRLAGQGRLSTPDHVLTFEKMVESERT
ncbi:MAG: phytoene/squalene synthase family protein [Myxococcota bacterium]|nr:phytoene/squalene synthase family protein [Myxococcota bacterium]